MFHQGLNTFDLKKRLKIQYAKLVQSHHIFQKAQLTLNKMVNEKRNLFCKVSHSFSNGVLHFVASLSSRNHLLTGGQ